MALTCGDKDLGWFLENRMWQKQLEGESRRWDEWKLKSYRMYFTDCLSIDLGLTAHRTVASHKRPRACMCGISLRGGLHLAGRLPW